MADIRPKPSWKYALIPILAMAVLALYPQISMWLAKGASWHGSYVLSNYDETAYSAFTNALIEGKPRRNDPFLAIDDTGTESLYSVQFIPAYSIALPAKLLGISTNTIFILLTVFLATTASLALFWFLSELTESPMTAATGTLLILCLGTAFAFHGELRYWINGRILIDFFPFLRRYQPGFAFPLLFIFFGFVWKGFSQNETKRTVVYSLISGLIFAVLVFSYFYIWTAAAAWLAIFVSLRLITNKENRGQIITGTVLITAIASASLIPYFLRLSKRSPNLDSVQLLTNTHAPEIASPSVIIGILIVAVIVFLVWRGRVKLKDPKVLLALSFSVTPLILFNQQVVTGRSLQPVHYEIFIANYLVITALVLLAASMFLSGKQANINLNKILAYVSGIAIIWGFVEASGPTRRNALAAAIRDDSIPAIEFIKQNEPDKSSVVLATNFVTSDFIPTVSTFRPLWNPHTSSAGGVDIAENKRLFYQYLYYSGFSEKDLGEALAARSFEVTAAIFGSERALPELGNGEIIKSVEIQNEVRKFGVFTKNLDAQAAYDPKISYIVVPAKAEPNFSNLDRWYQRDEGRITGLFKVYALVPKSKIQ